MKVIVGGYCWLDANALSEEQLSNLRVALTIKPSRTSEHDNKDPDPIHLYKEDSEKGLIGVPRQFYLDANAKSGRTHEEELRVSDGAPMGKFDSLMSYKKPYEEQLAAIDALGAKVCSAPFGGMLLKAGCAFGKTNTALAFARNHGRRTLIVVHKEFLMNQWRRRIRDFMPGARVGIIRQDKCSWKDCDFVIAMMDSLASKTRGYPMEIYDGAFGLLMFDEVHRVGAQTWSPIPPQFNARWRLGLTATDRRRDGAEGVFQLHIGPVTYEAKTPSLVPDIRRIFTDTKMRAVMKYGKIKGAKKLSRAEVVGQLTSEESRTRQIMEDVYGAVAQGRKVMVLSERIIHLREMAEDLNRIVMARDLTFPVVVDFYTGSWYTGARDKETGKLLLDRDGEPRKKRRTEAELDKAERANVIFATNQMVQEGLDIQPIDVLVIATPISDVEQAAGRVRRHCLPEPKKCKLMCPWRAGVCQGKPRPIITEVVDESVPSAMAKYRSRVRFYRDIGAL